VAEVFTAAGAVSMEVGLAGAGSTAGDLAAITAATEECTDIPMAVGVVMATVAAMADRAPILAAASAGHEDGPPQAGAMVAEVMAPPADGGVPGAQGRLVRALPTDSGIPSVPDAAQSERG
jgi:hypothetical protein